MKRLFFLSLLLFLMTAATLQTASADGLVPAATVEAGGTAVLQVALSNETDAAHDYTLSVSGLSYGMRTTFSQDGPIVEATTVPAHGTVLLTVRIKVPADMSVGHYTGTLIATRDDGVNVYSALSLSVTNTYAARITSQNISLTTFSGQEFGFDVSASNTGAADLTQVGLTVNAPPKWVVQVDPASVDSVAPGSSTDFHVQIMVPASQIAIDQPIDLTVTSDQTASPSSTLTVRVQSSPSYLLIAGVIIVAAIAGVFAYVRLKGRR